MVDANVLEEDGNQLTARQNHAVNIFFDLCEMPGAIFANFQLNNWRFILNKCYDYLLQTSSSLSKVANIFAENLAKIFFKIITSVPRVDFIKRVCRHLQARYKMFYIGR
jgi:methyltransferase-like protein